MLIKCPWILQKNEPWIFKKSRSTGRRASANPSNVHPGQRDQTHGSDPHNSRVRALVTHMASEESGVEDTFWHSLGNLRSAQDAATDPAVSDNSDSAPPDADVGVGGGAAAKDLEAERMSSAELSRAGAGATDGGTSAAAGGAQPDADVGVGGGAAAKDLEAERVSSAELSRAGAGATDGGASANAGDASASSTSASSHAAGRWQPPDITVDAGFKPPRLRVMHPFACQIRLPPPPAAGVQLPNAVRFRISLTLQRPGVQPSASTAGSLAYTPLDQLPLPLPHPPLQLLRDGRREDLVAPELDVPLGGKPVKCQLQISHGVTSSAYREHRNAGGLVWEASTASGAASPPPTALFCLRFEPVDPSLAAEHPELSAITTGFQIVTRLRSVARGRPQGEAADESAASRFRSLSISGSAPLRMPAGPPRLPAPRMAGAPRFRVLSGSAAGGRVGAVGGSCELVCPGSRPACRPCSAAAP